MVRKRGFISSHENFVKFKNNLLKFEIKNFIYYLFFDNFRKSISFFK